MKSCLLALPWHLCRTGGVNEVVKSLLFRLKESRKYDPVLLVTSNDRDEAWDASQVFPTVYEMLPGPFEGRSRLHALGSFLYRLPARMLRLRRLLLQKQIQLVNPHFPHPGLLPFVWLRSLRLWDGAIVLSFHLGDAHIADSTRGVERKLWQYLLGSADQIICPSDDLYQPLLRVAPGCRERLATINNGVDFELCSSRPVEPHRFPSELDGRPVILSVGAFEERKGHQTLMHALPQVRQRVVDAGLLVLGTGRPYLQELEKLRSELGLEGSVFFLQDIPHDKLPSYLSRARVFALATRSETFCLAILEAGAAGLPVVSTRAPGVIEVLKDGITGQLVEIGDVAGFAKAILRVLENPSEAAAVANNFRAEIKDHLTWDHHFENYRRIYDRF